MPYPPPGAARPLVAAAAVFRDDDGRVLLVHPVYKPGWELPGGIVEAGESPAVACPAARPARRQHRRRRRPVPRARAGGQPRRCRMSPSCTTEATSTPSRV
ncbi:NUDIX hydrolase [Actinomycetospora flava]|uniref:NUDIX hydrolase n=1 Tax=Actinomycetospora flava TaxID=3129232 RepID=A0ABU8M1J3_9PSEU